jgi:hypothetical protein
MAEGDRGMTNAAMVELTDDACDQDEFMTDADAPIVDAKDVMTRLSNEVCKLSAGDRAGLRRIFLTERYEADGVVIGLLHRIEMEVPSRADAFRAWRLLAHVAALLAGTAGVRSHSRQRLGSALHAAKYSETAMLRLLAARGVMLRGQVIRAARRLAQQDRGPVDLWTVFDLIGNDVAKVEEARLKIARAYYSAEARAEGDSK